MENKIFSFSSSLLISSSVLSNFFVDSAEYLSTSFTPKNFGFSLTITQAFGEIDTSQSVKAYKASIVTLGD